MPNSTIPSHCKITSSRSQRRASPHPVFDAELYDEARIAPEPADWAMADDSVNGDTSLQRVNVEHLCTTILWLRSWWESHQEAVRAIDSKAASEVHDHFIDGTIFARGTARGMKLDLDEQRIGNYR